MEENENRCVRGSRAYTRFIETQDFVLVTKKATNINRLSERKKNVLDSYFSNGRVC